MGETGSADIRFFDLKSRIGRCRYLAYGIGLGLAALVPAFVAGMVMAFVPALGVALLVVLYIAVIVFNVGFGVRRLHDLDKTGWLMLLMIIPLVNLGLVLYLIFAPGTAGENRFGAPPPPNSGWVIAGVVAYVAVIPLGIIAALAIPSYSSYLVRAQMSEAEFLASGGKAGVSEYAQEKEAWPASLADVYSTAGQHPAGKYVDSLTASVSPDGSSYGIIATMKTEGVNSSIAGKAVEVWSNDRGMTWHCGPASVNPVDPMQLSPSCREIDPPPP